MDPGGLDGLREVGRLNYAISGIVGGGLLFFAPYIASSVGNMIVAMTAGLAVLVNSLAVNYCIRQWRSATSAQRDIAKLLFRVTTLLVALNLAITLGIDSIISSVAIGISILFLPLSIEAVFVVQKSKS